MFGPLGRMSRRRVMPLKLRQVDEESGPDSDSDIDELPSPQTPKTPSLPPTPIPKPRPNPPSPPAELTSSSSVSMSTSTAESVSTATLSSVTTETQSTTTTLLPGIIPVDNPGTPQPAISTDSVTLTSSPSVSTSTTSVPNPGLPLRIPSVFTTSTRSPTASPTEEILGIPTSDTQDVLASKPSGPQPGAKAGIAVGSIAAAALLVSILFFLWRRFQTRKSRRSVIEDMEPATARPTDGRTDSQILQDLLATARAHQSGNGNGNGGLIPAGYVVSDEKKGGPVTILDGAPLAQAEIRLSIASWLRRHHPLKLNPMSDRGSLRSASRCSSGVTTPRAPTPRSPASLKLQPPSPLGNQPPAQSDAQVNQGPQAEPSSPQAPNQSNTARFQSVWSETTVSTMPSEGNTSILYLYGDRESGRLTRDLTGKRASSPALNAI